MTKPSDDRIEASGSDFDPIVHEISLMKQIILERYHPLDLIRELVSNAAAKEVGATEIRIKYTVDDTGHIFEVTDNGCGMDYTGDPSAPGRLDRFFGLGLSNIVGIKGDEFSWKGLGSKLAYHSRAIEIHTSLANRQAYRVEINDPWSTIERGLKPKPKIFNFQEEAGKPSGTIQPNIAAKARQAGGDGVILVRSDSELRGIISSMNTATSETGSFCRHQYRP